MVLCSQRRAPEQQQADPHTRSLSEGPDTTSGPSAFLQVPPSPTGSTASMQATGGAALSVDQTNSPIAGRCMGLDVVSSPSMPLTLSTNQDRVIVARRDDLFLGETPPMVEIVRDFPVGAQALASRVRVRRYMAFGAIRPTGVQIISGAALANPYT